MRIINLFFLSLFFVNLSWSADKAKPQAMVVSEQYLASYAGAKILKAGGNAVDAAVAVGYALAVVAPDSGNIGGGGFMNIHFANGKNIFINFREKAPYAAYPEMYLDAQGKVIPRASTHGFRAVGVPGTVLGLDTALAKYGTMPRSVVMQPAIELAEKGFIVSPYLANQLKTHEAEFKKHANIMAIFFKNGQPYRAKARLRQLQLAKTLKAIAAQGPKVFYEGYIAQAIVKASQQNNGILTLEDFKKYNISETEPLYCSFRDYQIISAPLPSSGGTTLCEMLQTSEYFPLKQLKFRSTASMQYLIETMRYAYIDRNSKLGDAKFIQATSDRLISKEYAKTLADKIAEQTKLPTISAPPANRERAETTHYSVLDANGNAVSVTYTLNGPYGAMVIAGDTGFFLNDEMDDFSSGPNIQNQYGLVQSFYNQILPGKRPLSSMTPTIVLRAGQVALVIGSPGGPRITTSVFLTLLNVLEYDISLDQAINTPRFHFQSIPSSVSLEPQAISDQVKNELEKKGYTFVIEKPWGAVEAIEKDMATGSLIGAYDKRRPDGKAVGVSLD